MPRVGLFVPCFIDQFRPGVARAALRVLERVGVRAEYAPAQTCCGQPAFNAGHWPQAAALMTRLLDLFAEYDEVVAPSGSCVALLRHQAARLGADPRGVAHRVFELSEYLVVRRGVVDLGARLAGRAALHMPCHLANELGAAPHVRALLGRVAGLEIVPTAGADDCCGFGGLFSVNFPELSCAIGARKVDAMIAEGVDYLVSPESSCLLHLQGLLEARRSPIRVLHLAEVLAGPEAP